MPDSCELRQSKRAEQEHEIAHPQHASQIFATQPSLGGESG
jgi:hypothetical protein